MLEAASAVGVQAGWNVLDVGAGSGALSVAMHAKFGGRYELTEYADPTPVVREALLVQGIEAFSRSDLGGREPFSGLRGNRDLLLLVEVLEHLLVNPFPLVAAMGRLLRPGGYLILTTPNQVRFHNRVGLLRGRSFREVGAFPQDGSPIHGHVQEYTLEEVSGFLTAAGLHMVQHRVVQNAPTLRPSRGQRMGTRWLNGAFAQRWRLGDELIVVAQRQA